ncbi:DUF6207 family protein [Streptomyces sp. NPDC006971]
MTTLDQLWATSGTRPTRRTPGEPGLGARVYADIQHCPAD